MIFEGRWVFSTDQESEGIRIEVENGVVIGTEPCRPTDSARYLSPGFFDVQVNGYNGIDYSLSPLRPEHVRNIAVEMAQSGVTKHVATIVTSPQKRILENLTLIARQVKTEGALEGAVAGAHLEGPYISDEDGPRGAHDRAYTRDPDVHELDEWISASDGLLRVVTFAPERRGALAFIEALLDRNIVPAIGHTGATPEEIRRAADAGALVSTHLGNGSHAMLPRLKNYLWEQLADDRLVMGLICDGFHVPGSVVKCLVRAKGLDRTVLVSDVALFGGSEPGRYAWGNIEVEVHSDGHLSVADTPYLAGAGHTLAWAIPRFIEYTGASISQTIRLCTANPARLFGLPLRESPPTKGANADLVQFRYSSGFRMLEIERVVRGAYALENTPRRNGRFHGSLEA